MAVYIELYGLPGAGKTTLCRPVISILKDMGYKVASLDDVYNRNCRGGRKYSVFLKMLFKVKLYPLYYKFWKFFMSCNPDDRDFSYFVKALFLSYQILDTNKNGDFDVILCEEGFIQYISSFCYSDEMLESVALKKLCTYISSLLILYTIHCNLDTEESFKRINGRPVISRRFSSSCSSEILKKALISKDANLKIISSHFPKAINLDMLKDVADNQKALIEFINKILNFAK